MTSEQLPTELDIAEILRMSGKNAAADFDSIAARRLDEHGESTESTPQVDKLTAWVAPQPTIEVVSDAELQTYPEPTGEPVIVADAWTDPISTEPASMAPLFDVKKPSNEQRAAATIHSGLFGASPKQEVSGDRVWGAAPVKRSALDVIKGGIRKLRGNRTEAAKDFAPKRRKIAQVAGAFTVGVLLLGGGILGLKHAGEEANGQAMPTTTTELATTTTEFVSSTIPLNNEVVVDSVAEFVSIASAWQADHPGADLAQAFQSFANNPPSKELISAEVAKARSGEYAHYQNWMSPQVALLVTSA